MDVVAETMNSASAMDVPTDALMQPGSELTRKAGKWWEFRNGSLRSTNRPKVTDEHITGIAERRRLAAEAGGSKTPRLRQEFAADEHHTPIGAPTDWVSSASSAPLAKKDTPAGEAAH